jgi:hypothetical protein
VPEFITADNATETRPEDPAFTAVNRLLGRRFKVISYQWLQPDEI